jgi:hypothetical protein
LRYLPYLPNAKSFRWSIHFAIARDEAGTVAGNQPGLSGEMA